MPTLAATSGCPGLEVINPICQVGGAASSVVGGVAGAGIGAVFSGLTSWVVNGASWLVAQIGSVLDTTTSVDVGAKWFGSHYQTMLGLLGVVALPMALASILQAVLRQDASSLVRSLFVRIPLAMVLAAGAIKMVQLGLATTDALSNAVSSSSGDDIHRALSSVGSGLSASSADPGIPAFVALLGALLVVLAALGLWIELLVRAAAVYVAVLFLPLSLASLVWPAISHWCRRLVETLAALILSKFVIVAILSLAAGAVGSGLSGQAGAGGSAGSSGSAGESIRAVLAGAALLLLSAFSPFVLLRLVPIAEAGAIGHLEGVRHRAQHMAVSAPISAAQFALAKAKSSSFDPGEPGTGGVSRGGGARQPGAGAGSAGSAVDARSGGAPGAGGGDNGGQPGPDAPGDGAPMWKGDPSTRPVDERSEVRDNLPAPPRRTRGKAPLVWGYGPPGSPMAAPTRRPGTARAESAARQGDWLRLGAASRGVHVVERDDIGPVIRWIPTNETSAEETPSQSESSPKDGGDA